MLRLLRNKRAQNTAEYAILIALIIGVFSAMQLYVRRGLQARVKAGTDNLPEMIVNTHVGADTDKVTNLFGTDKQYEPYYIRQGAYDMTTNSSEGTEKGLVSEQGGVRDLEDATTKREGYQTVTGAKDDNLNP